MVTIFCLSGAVELVDVRVGRVVGDRDSACNGELPGGAGGVGEPGEKFALGGMRGVRN